MATNTLGEFSDGEDDFVFQIDENLIPNINEDEVLTNTLGQFSDGEDDFVFQIDENLWNNSEDDDYLIRNIDEDKVLTQTGRGEKRKTDGQDEEPGEYYYHMESVKKTSFKEIPYVSHRSHYTIQ